MIGGKRVAVMQPYFFPYAGYFALLREVDELVIFDCVQFPRRGRVHRTEVPHRGGSRWLTLPLRHHERSVRIADVRFATDARRRLDDRLAREAWITTAPGDAADRLRAFLSSELDDVVSYLETGLRLVADLLGIDVAMTRSSSLGLPASLRGQARVIEVALARGAGTYVNPSGGRALYEREAFQRSGLELRFMPEYTGPFRHMLHDLMVSGSAAVAADVDRVAAPG